MNNFIPVNTPRLAGNEKKYLNECIDSGWISSEGPFVKQFEDKFAFTVDRKFACSVVNGTAALELAFAALEIQAGDEVIMPTLTIISCVLAVVRLGAIPVFVDVEPDTWNMQVDKVEALINSKTKAILIAHTYGLAVNAQPILDLAKKYNLFVIEDAAEAHGLNYNTKKCGSLGDVSIFSFYPNKLITTGEGGMVVTDDDRLFDRLQSLRNLAFTEQDRFCHYELGYNYRFTNLQAAVGLAQLENWHAHIQRKREIGLFYQESLQNLELLQLPVAETLYCQNIYWVFGLVIKDPKIAAKSLMAELQKQGVGTRPFFYPLHQQPVLLNKNIIEPQSLPMAEMLSRQGFYLPSGLGITDEELGQVVLRLKGVIENL